MCISWAWIYQGRFTVYFMGMQGHFEGFWRIAEGFRRFSVAFYIGFSENFGEVSVKPQRVAKGYGGHQKESRWFNGVPCAFQGASGGSGQFRRFQWISGEFWLISR